MLFFQELLVLEQKSRGFHIITNRVEACLPNISEIKIGMLQVFIQHTSASLCVNENADPTVRQDFEMFFSKTVKENDPDYKHDYEGSDDMPAHLKSALLGSSVSIPIRNGKLALGIWQGIYFCEDRNYGGARKLLVTAWGTGF
nr:secondary thiamine-phosphate synthase enzyme YjbQ [uncultured Pedobacter sp.]